MATAKRSILCPRCGYDLRGLPLTYQCPECAFEYDPAAITIRLKGARPRMFDFYAILGVAGGMGIVLMVVFGGTAARSWLSAEHTFGEYALQLAKLAAVSVAGCFAGKRIIRRLTGTQELLINRLGIQFVDPDMPTDRIPWRLVGQALHNGNERAFLILDKSGNPIARCADDVIGDDARIGLCVSKINELRKEYERANDAGRADAELRIIV